MAFKLNSYQQSLYPTHLTQRINQSLQKLSLLQSTQFNLQSFIKNIIQSQQFEDWIILKEVLQNQQLKKVNQLYSTISKVFQYAINYKQLSYVMTIFLYGWLKHNKTQRTIYGITKFLKDLANDGGILMLISWLTEANCQSTQVSQTLNMICKYYPLLVTQENIQIQNQELQLFIHIICRIQLKSAQQFQDFDKLVGLIKLFRLNITSYRKQTNDYQSNKQEYEIIKTTLNILANNKNCKGSAAWIFIPSIINISDVFNFVSFYQQNLLLYSENQLVRIFSVLFQSSIQQNTLTLFYQISKIFKEADRYYELKILYQKIVLPIIARRGKAKVKLTQFILEISSFYIIGFYGHCDIGFNGFVCLLNNINKINQNQMKIKWIVLSFLMADKNRKFYENQIYQDLINQGFKKQELSKIDQQRSFGKFGDSHIWEVTVRNSRKLKIYQKNPSKSYKGIQNHSLQCYIISVIQALFTTKQLPRIFKEYTYIPRKSLCYHLNQLFKDLINSRSTSVSVDEVKNNGPQFFALSHGQQDAQQYLLKVFQMIEQELIKQKQKLLLQEFNKAFKLKITRKIQCQNCKNVIDKEEEQFIHTIPNRSSLRQKQVQQINDYKCQKCSSTKFLNKIQIHPTSTVLIIHFNRFSYKNQQSQKQLATQTIYRQFLGYRLKGIVFHIGKNVQCGHYVYYFCIGGKKWAEMNDSKVMQFTLQDQNEEFESQMKAQMTPYILFYTKK